MRVLGPILAFLVFPCLPTLVVMLVPSGYGPAYVDRGVIAVVVGVAATVASGTIGYRRDRSPATATLYVTGTALLSVIAFVAFIWAVFEYYCGDDPDGSC